VDENDQLYTCNDDIVRGFVQYYQHLFTTAAPNNIGACTHAVKSTVSPEMNSQFLSVFTVEEVDHALSQMEPLKAPGLDGFMSGFYQQNWATVGGEVFTAVLSFLNSGNFDETINATNI
jgi:hypothetical protein